MSAGGPSGADLDLEVERLVQLLRGRGPGWYAARPHRGPTRGQTLRDLVAALARLGAVADTGQPPDAMPSLLGDHALGDQVRLLAHELGRAADEAVTPAAVAEVRGARARL